MNISIFDSTGPIMIGSSSSHTAGAARLARIAALIAGGPFSRVSFGLHGSFAKTYRGHGTDRALVFGALGYREDDERLPQAFELAKHAGLAYDFYEINLEGAHENTAKITFFLNDGTRQEIVGSSIGGAQIVIHRINGFETDFTAQSPALFISQQDRPGTVSDVTAVLADYRINIGVMKVSRKEKGGLALCTIETDDPIPEEAVQRLKKVRHVLSAQAVNLMEEDE